MLSLKIEIVWSVLLLYNSHLKILPVSLSCSILNISGIYSVYGDCGHTLNSLAPVRFANTLCSLFHVWLLKITLLRKFWSGKTIMKSQRVAFTYAIASKICTILSDALLLHRHKKWTSTPCSTQCVCYTHTHTRAQTQGRTNKRVRISKSHLCDLWARQKRFYVFSILCLRVWNHFKSQSRWYRLQNICYLY